jgi:glycosyltransferase involved in cell wall biosynthesis
MKILYFQHVGLLGGSGRSLYELIRALKAEIDVNFIVACPTGKLQNLFSELGCEIFSTKGLSNFDNNRYSYYVGLRWLILIREFFLLFPTVILFLKLKKTHRDVNIVHINEITMPIVGLLSKLFYPNALIICHARAIQRKKRNLVSKILGRINNWSYDYVICIDENVASSFPYKINKIIIHNGLPLPKEIRPKLKKSTIFRVGMVGSLNKSKGSMALLGAANLLKERNLNTQLNFLIFGAVPRTKNKFFSNLLSLMRLKEDLYFEALEFLKVNNLTNCVKLLTYEENLDAIYDKIDLVCFPSLLDAPGRPIFEAGVYGKPAIVSISEPRYDTFLPGKVGLIVKPNDEYALANAIERYVKNPKKYFEHSKCCIQFYQNNFDIKKSACVMIDVYSSNSKLKRLPQCAE